MQARVIRKVWVFDGQTVQPVDSLVIDDGVITEVGSAPPGPPGAVVLDGCGATVMPGLIDVHPT